MRRGFGHQAPASRIPESSSQTRCRIQNLIGGRAWRTYSGGADSRPGPPHVNRAHNLYNPQTLLVGLHIVRLHWSLASSPELLDRSISSHKETKEWHLVIAFIYRNESDTCNAYYLSAEREIFCKTATIASRSFWTQTLVADNPDL